MFLMNYTSSLNTNNNLSYTEIIRTDIECNATYLKDGEYYINFICKKNICDKEFVYNLYNNELSFGKEEDESAEKAMARIAVTKQKNLYDYYA